MLIEFAFQEVVTKNSDNCIERESVQKRVDKNNSFAIFSEILWKYDRGVSLPPRKFDDSYIIHSFAKVA